MTPRLSALDTLTLLLAAAFVGLAGYVFVAGPTRPIPLHWGLDGSPDRYGGRGELAFWLAAMSVMILAIAGGLGWAAARQSDRSRVRGLRLGQGISLLAFAGVGTLIATVSLGVLPGAPGPQWVMAALSLLFAAVGAVVGRVAPNPFVGVRTPWTFKSRLAWDRSNRLAGRLFFLIGLAGLVSAPLAPQPAGLFGLVGLVLSAALWSVIESWRVWRADPERQPF